MQTIGILGAGKVGVVIAQLAIKAGYEVYIAGSGDPEKIALTVRILTNGAKAVTSKEAVQKSDLVILALPLSKYKSIPQDAFDGKLVIDAMNHWYEVDGPRIDTLPDDQTSSEAVQAFLPHARVIKALSHTGYHELHDYAHAESRKAIAIAGNTSEDTEKVAAFIESLGFDPLIIGSLADGEILEPGHAGFGTNLSKADLQKLLSTTV